MLNFCVRMGTGAFTVVWSQAALKTDLTGYHHCEMYKSFPVANTLVPVANIQVSCRQHVLVLSYISLVLKGNQRGLIGINPR